MKLSTVSRELDEIVSRLDTIASRECAGLRDEMRSIECQIRDVRRDVFALSVRQSVEAKSPSGDSTTTTTREAQIKSLQEKLDEIEKKINL